MATFVNPLAQVMPGFGSPSMNGLALSPVGTTTPLTMTIPATGATTPATGGSVFNPTGMPAPSSGKIRYRTGSVSAAVTTSATFTVTDGTTTLQVGQIPASAAGVAVDQLLDFETDLKITSISCVTTLGGTVGTGVAVSFAVSLV